MSDDEWTWELAPTAQEDLAALDPPNKSEYLTNLTKSSIHRGVIPRTMVNRSRTVHAKKYV